MIQKLLLLLIIYGTCRAGVASSPREIIVPIPHSQLQARLYTLDPLTLAIREVPFADTEEARNKFRSAYFRYLNQITMELVLEPRTGVILDPKHPFALDIENNGGVWGNWNRNLQRLLFEMEDFINLKISNKKEIRPLFVSFQRHFGYSQEASFLIGFPRTVEGHEVLPPLSLQLKEFGQGLGEVIFSRITIPSMEASKKAEDQWKKEISN